MKRKCTKFYEFQNICINIVIRFRYSIKFLINSIMSRLSEWQIEKLFNRIYLALLLSCQNSKKNSFLLTNIYL